jgi:hypothetical protein
MGVLPDWNSYGILPPFNSAQPTGFDRSPYIITFSDFVLRFMSSLERIEILKGLAAYRRELYSIGIVSGFQWIDGSFLENVEHVRQTPPNDIDVTTFFYINKDKELQKRKRHQLQQKIPMPISISRKLKEKKVLEKDIEQRNPKLFDNQNLKQKYHVDGYYVNLNYQNYEESIFCIQQCCYWYSLWSLQKQSFRWKGFAQISLDPTEIKTIIQIIENQKNKLENPL